MRRGKQQLRVRRFASLSVASQEEAAQAVGVGSGLADIVVILSRVFCESVVHEAKWPLMSDFEASTCYYTKPGSARLNVTSTSRATSGRVHRGCTRTQNAANRGYQRDAQTAMVTRNTA